MKAFEAPKAIALTALFTAVLAYGGEARGAGQDLRCETRALQIEAKLLRGVVSCRETAERRRSFNEERCLTKCESGYDDAYSKLLCATDRRLVRELTAADTEDLREEANLLYRQARELRCLARCEYSGDPDACVEKCEVRYGYTVDMTTGQLGDQPFEGSGPTCTMSADGLTLECEYGDASDATAGDAGGVAFDAPEGPDCTPSADGTTLECR